MSATFRNDPRKIHFLDTPDLYGSTGSVCGQDIPTATSTKGKASTSEFMQENDACGNCKRVLAQRGASRALSSTD